ncbi:gustatory receptor for sugar taste 64f-like isoform X2 [Prorops nasuta]|uniref:gustatory receptor for sugar taste 64f-like isoform X2 n=1 Tax=Prorops nasuta TaxID=863751 RepID=UPI0034CEDA09
MRSCGVHTVRNVHSQIRSLPTSSCKIGRSKGEITATESKSFFISVMPSSNTFDPAVDSFYSSMRPVIILAQCFSMFPICGVNRSDASCLKFTWRSPKILYCGFAILGSIFLTMCNIVRLAVTGIDSRRTTSLVFYAANIVTSLLFVRLARQWPCLMLTWEKLEGEFSSRHRKLSKRSLSSRFKIMTAFVMVLALIEHTFSILSGYTSALECAALRGDNDIFATYFRSQFPQVFSRISYNPWAAVAVYILNILSTFSWNFIDLFLILVSMALIDQFRQLNSRLYSIRGKAMPEWWWAEARNDYNHLATLTRRVDTHLSATVLLSFAINLYFICIQLLNSFKPMDVIQKIYFCFSFGFLLARTTAVSLYAAAVHDESLLPAPILYSVTTSSYSMEVMRFLTQVTTDNISFTGMKFFSITRSLVLTVAGTIVTYELVLVQFNSVQQVDPSNITNACEILPMLD